MGLLSGLKAGGLSVLISIDCEGLLLGLRGVGGRLRISTVSRDVDNAQLMVVSHQHMLSFLRELDRANASVRGDFDLFH